MSTVYSVSEITSIFDTTIRANPTLLKVRVQGEVIDKGPKYFFLIPQDGPGEKKLRCFIPFGIAAPLIKDGDPVVVEGQITLYTNFSQYQVQVSGIQDPKVNGNGATDVAGITNLISGLVTETPELQNIQVQGKIFIGAYGLALRDDDDKFYELKVDNPDAISVPVGGKVGIRGKVSIDYSESRYRIEVTAIGGLGAPMCQCSGGASCTKAGCNAAREPKYELCPRCYEDSDDHEEKVVEAVKTYFSNLKVKGFSPKIEYGIQMGTDNRRADVVLVKVKNDGTKVFAAIAECKGAGYVGEGKRQLKSYLSATDARFGVFANRADKEHWKFYENRRRNRFDCISREEFEAGVVKGITHLKRLKDEIETLESTYNELGAKIDDLSNEISTLERQKRELMDEIRHSETLFEDLNNEIGDLERQKCKLMDEIQHSETLFEDLKNDLSAKIGDLRTEIGDLERQKGKLTEEIRHSETFFADLNNEVGDLEHRTRELMKEIRHSETFFADLKKDLSEQFKTFLADLKRDKKQGIMNKLKNLFSKENE